MRPEEVEVAPARLEEIAGGDPAENARLLRRVLNGQPGPALEIVALNAGAAILVGGGAGDLRSGIAKAREAIDSGAAARVLDRLVALSEELAPA